MSNMKELVNKYDAVALFSGGLDSILAMRVIMDQGLRVLGLNFCSPFFGNPENVEKWRQLYGIEVIPVDITEDMLALIKNGPKNGFGSALNPCIDCHTLMATKAKEIMEELNAKFIISGEVLWQRPMSQRPDALNIVHRDSRAKGLLLRPLSALKMEPTEVELSGLVDRNRLLGIYGRGRIEQLQLAKDYGFTEIPGSGGGCILTERTSSGRLWAIFREFEHPTGEDFLLAKAGRFFFHAGHILAINKTVENLELLLACQKPSDVTMELADYMGPFALGRSEQEWDEATIKKAATLMASYANKAIRNLPEGTPLRVLVKHNGEEQIISVVPNRNTLFQEAKWETAAEALKAINKRMTDLRVADKQEKFNTWISRKIYKRQKQEQQENKD